VWTGSYVYLPSSDRVSVQVGEPSPRNIMAPRRLVYVSEIKTEEARSAAAALVGDIYTGPNLAIADEQLTRLQDTLARLEVLRNDGLVDGTADRLAQARGVADLGLDDPQWISLLEADADSWQAIGAEALRVLDLVMHDDIREGQAAAKAQQAYRLVRRDLSATERDLVIRIATAFVVPNNFLDIEQTAMSRQNARRLVEPVQWTIRAGESVVREGEIVSPLALEKLGVLGLLKEPPRWDDLIGALVLTTCLVVAVAVYVYRAQPVLLLRPRRQLLLALTLMVAGATARMSIPGHVLLPYLFPAASFCMLVAVLLNLELAVFTAAILSVLVGLNASGSMELVAYVLVGGVIGALAISQIDQLSAFVRAAAYVALSNAGIVLAFQMSNHMHDALGLVQLLTAALSNGVLSASLAFVAFLVIGRLFGITTFVQLMELARPTHPLFRQLLLEAPGTYHHSIVVSNMAERAAQAIGADPLLVRVGSYYHDIGKIRRPYFFAENQNDGDNPHDKLDPKTSAEIIIAHTSDGLALARKHRLPDRVCDFITEHHGTTLASYFYHQATRQPDGDAVDVTCYRYPGPRPQSKETAIVMLADSIEAAVRAKRPTSQEDTAAVAHKVIGERLSSGQLDEADITMRDLDQIRQAFLGILRGVFHPRIDYPETASLPQATAAVLSQTPATPSDPGVITP
jgi:putative nucleotidyltransferase with HDIG domain